MEEACFTPGMFCQSGITVLNKNRLIYIWKSNIVVLNEEASLPRHIKYAHSNIIRAVVAAPGNASDTLKSTFVSCGDDGFVRLWCADTLKAIKAHQTHISRHKEKTIPSITAASWSTVNPNLVVSVANNGAFVMWYIAENLTTKYGVSRANFTAVACSKTDENVIAAASVSSVALIRINNTKMTFTLLRVFQKSISHLAWQPETDILCITSVKGEIALWNMAVPTCIKMEKVPQKGYDEIILPVLWADKNTLICRTNDNVIAADPQTLFAESETIKWTTLHSQHKRDIFALARSSGLVWSIAGDRTFIGYNLETKKVEKAIGCLFGGAICGEVSPHDPNLIAFGSDDKTIRLWNVTEPTGSCLCEGRNITDKVMSVSWHPVKDNLLLYGTYHGRIGVMDKSKAKPPYLLKKAGLGCKPVYWLCWGPKFLEPDNQNQILYAITNGTIYTYDDCDATTEPIDFGTMCSINGMTTDLAWKPDFSLLAIGTKTGAIFLMKPSSLEPVHTIAGHDQVQYLVWHPQMTNIENDESPYQNLLTFGNLNPNGEIRVYKIDELDSVVTSSIFATLKGHKGYVQSVAWSPHISGQLVSTSDDCSIQVWNVLTETPIANFQNNCISWFSIWSPIDPDFIISGSKDSIIHVWKISAQTAKLPTGELKLQSKSKKSKKIVHKCEEAVNQETSETQPSKKKENPKDSHSYAKMADFVPQANKIKETSVIPNAWSKQASDFSNCYRLLKADDSEHDDLFRLVFLKKDIPAKQFSQLEQVRQNASQIDGLTSLMLYQGKIKELIEQKIEQGGLTDTLVALAPSVSPRLWHSACVAYARQLVVANRYTEAANYLIAARELDKAVTVLCEGYHFVEALCLVKTRLSDTNGSRFNEIVGLYAKDLENKGDFDRACECWIYLKDYEEVSRCLARSQDKNAQICLSLAAKKAGKNDICEKTLLSVLGSAIQNDMSDIFEKLEDIIADVLPAKLLYAVYKILNESSISGALFDRLEEIDLPAEFYSQILSIQLPTDSISQIWVKTKNLSLAYCSNGSESPQRMRHILYSLEAANLQGPSELFKCCRLLSPNLTTEGIFATENVLGISLRAFLCLAILNKPDLDEDIALTVLPELQKDLLDEKAFVYHRSKMELSALQKKIANSVGTELQSLLVQRNELIVKISKIEVERCVVPSPALGFLLLRNFYQNLSNRDETAKKYLADLTDRYFPLIN